MYCCNFCSRQVEEASLACGSEPTPDAYRQLLSAFARTSHSPSSQWWEQLRSCLEVATAPVTHTQPLQDSLSRDAELSGVLTAVCAFRWAMAAAQRRVAHSFALLVLQRGLISAERVVQPAAAGATARQPHMQASLTHASWIMGT